jgi:magnesium transporter
MQQELTKDQLHYVQDIIQKGDEHALIEFFAPMHAADIAEIVDELHIDQSKLIFQVLDAQKASEVLVNLDEDERDDIVASFTSQELAELFIENLESDDAADVLTVLPDEQKEEVISHLDDVEQASDIVDLLNYKEGTAGSLMAKELIKVKQEWTVSTCVKEMRRQAENVDNIYTVYVVDEEGHLLGRLSLKTLLTTPVKTKIADLYKPEIKYVKTYTDIESIANQMEKYDLVAMPVVDELGRLVGRITIDDVVDVIKEEAEKDYQLASGISQNVEASDSVWILTRARLPWLLLGLLGGIFGAQVIGMYETEIQLYPEMAFFIPLIAAMGGNVGVQSSAIVVQSIANNSFDAGAIAPKLAKEFSVAFLNGIVCSILLLGYNVLFSPSLDLSYTVSLALMAVILFAGLFGTFVPLVLNRYKVDPALATGPFITTVNDILGLLIYFSIGHAMYVA